MNILRHESRWHIRLLRGWILAVFLTLALFLSFYTSFEAEAENLIDMLEGFPREVMQGFGLDVTSFGTFSGYLAYIYTFIQLLLGILAVLCGMQLIGREKLNKTSDFLFSKPISRSSMWAQKILVGILGMVLVNGLIALTVYVLARLQDHPFDAPLKRVLIGSLLVQLILFFLGALLSSMKKRIKTVTGPAASIGMGFYFLLIIGRLLEEEKLLKLSIYGLFDASVVERHPLETTNIVIALVLILIFAGVGYWRYTQEDLEV